MNIWSGENQNTALRAIHPLAYLIVRPVVWLLTPLAGSGFHAALLATCLAGALGVLVFHQILSRLGAGAAFSTICTAIFGFANTQLFFGSNIESYIFSSLFLLLFVLECLRNDRLWRPILAMLAVFGMTASNLVQPVLILVTRKTPLKKLLLMLFWVGSIGVAGVLIGRLFYPNSDLFFVPSSLFKEQAYVFSALDMPKWRGIGKTFLLVRTILLYTVLGPRPYMLLDPNRDPMLLFFKFSMSTFSYSEYFGVGSVAVYAWAGLLLASFVGMIRRVIKEKFSQSVELQLSAGLVLCIIFNFGFHLVYGFEPFLYSADWMYALLLLVAIGWMAIPRKRILESALLLFLVLEMANNLACIHIILKMINSFMS